MFKKKFKKKFKKSSKKVQKKFKKKFLKNVKIVEKSVNTEKIRLILKSKNDHNQSMLPTQLEFYKSLY